MFVKTSKMMTVYYYALLAEKCILNFIVSLTKISDSIIEMEILPDSVLVRYSPHFITKHSKTQVVRI